MIASRASAVIRLKSASSPKATDIPRAFRGSFRSVATRYVQRGISSLRPLDPWPVRPVRSSSRRAADSEPRGRATVIARLPSAYRRRAPAKWAPATYVGPSSVVISCAWTDEPSARWNAPGFVAPFSNGEPKAP